jgi:AcrR family transcriptional regulator
LNPIIALSGAPKGSLYHHFPLGHQEILSQALSNYADLIDQQLSRALEGPELLPVRIERLFIATAKRVQAACFEESCAVGAVLADGTGRDDALTEQCRAIVHRWNRTLARAMPEIASAQRAVFARQIVSLLEGAQLLARAHRSTQPLREAGALAASHARHLLACSPRSDHP